MTETTFDVHVEREFDAPIERVWAAWTVPDDLREWWGPTGFTCPHAEVDLRRGRAHLRHDAGAGRVGRPRVPQHLEHHRRSSPRGCCGYVYRFADADGRAITAAEAGIPAGGVPDAGEHEVRADRRSKEAGRA